MKHIYHSLLFVLLLGVTTTVNAQITFTESFFTDKLGTTETSTFFELDDSMDLTSIINASGANQTWDFSAFVATDTFSISETYIVLPADVPGADLFPNSNFAIELSSDSATAELGDSVSFHLFNSLANGFITTDGGVTSGDFDGDDVLDLFVTTNSPPSMDAPLPLTYETMWDDSTTIILTFDNQTIPPFSAELSQSVVDGWGTLITPQGSYQALRIKDEYYTRDLLTGTVTMTHTDYEFISLEGVFASIFVDANDGSTEASYSVSDSQMTGTSVDEESGVPTDYQLAQNYPNPFNPSTTISYSLPAATDVTLKIYSITGKEVATLVNATQGVGSYEVQFDASSLASGLYMYRLEAGSFTETRLMSFIK